MSEQKMRCDRLAPPRFLPSESYVSQSCDIHQTGVKLYIDRLN
ncbi:hypothetical protein [Microcoleus sp. FACHB-1515]|nr:hypothetical protein [Microcoleus sp. FACHB-1515]